MRKRRRNEVLAREHTVVCQRTVRTIKYTLRLAANFCGEAGTRFRTPAFAQLLWIYRNAVRESILKKWCATNRRMCALRQPMGLDRRIAENPSRFGRGFMKRKQLAILVVAFCFVHNAAAQGTIVFDSYGPIDGQRGNHVDMDFGAMRPVAFPFVPSQSGQLSTITTPLFWLGLGGTPTAELMLCRTDPLSGAPGQPLELFAARGTVPTYVPEGIQAPIVFRSTVQPMLDSAERYWLVLQVPSPSGVVWGSSPTQLTKQAWFERRGLVTYANDGIAIAALQIAVVPEPRAEALIAIGFLAVAWGSFGRGPKGCLPKRNIID